MSFRDWYDENILPRCIGFACADSKIKDLRGQIVPMAEGKVFELGCGGGMNQEYYDASKVTSFSGIDPGDTLLDEARAKAREKGWDVDLRHGKGEAIPFGDNSFDTVVCTYTMCSVDDPEKVLSEMRRILKPGGKLLYLEHGRAPDPGPAKWQRRIEPVWKPIMGNCHLTREIGAAVKRGGFNVEPVGSKYLPKMPKWAGWMEWGVGWKGGA